MMRVWTNLCASMSTPQMQALETELAPQIAEHTDAIRLDPRLFARVDAVHADRHAAGLTPEQVRVVERYHRDFVRAGAALPEADRDQLRDLNVQITSLTTEFSNRVLAESNDLAVHVTDRAELDGLAANAVEAAANAATSAGLRGVSAHALAADDPARHLVADEPGGAPTPPRGRDVAGHARRGPRHARARQPDQRAARRSALPCSASPTTPPTSPTTRPPAAPRPCSRCSTRWSSPRCATSRSSGPASRSLLRADGVEGPVSPGTGPTTRRRTRRRRTTSTPTP